MSLAVFIDSSIYLSFFSVSNDDLEQFSKIAPLIDRGAITLHIPKHVKREFERNRDNKLATTLSEYEKAQLKLPPIPRFMNDYEEIKRLRLHTAEANKAKNEALSKAREEATKFDTRADSIIRRIFESGNVIQETDELYDKALRRARLGEPPGKSDSIGDRLNWESMLASVPHQTDLHVVTKDSDYLSSLDKNLPHPSLTKEWLSIKKPKLYVHTEVRLFLSNYFSDFKFEIEKRGSESLRPNRAFLDLENLRSSAKLAERKEANIERLREASNDEELHEAIVGINEILSYFNNFELRKILDICLANYTIDYYGYDEHVRSFVASIITKIFQLLDKKCLSDVESIFGIKFEYPTLDENDESLTPNYQQMDLDHLDDIVDEELSYGAAESEPELRG